MLNNIVLYGLIIAGCSYLYLQNESNRYKVNQLQYELKTTKEATNNKLKELEFNTAVLVKKKALVKEIKYDKKEVYDINGTNRFYLK